MSHTPGPWEAMSQPEERCSSCGAEYPFWVGNHEREAFVADVLAEGDARLIAAAPELLEALKAARYWMGEVIAGFLGDHAEHKHVIIKQMDAAIAKGLAS